MKNIIINFDCLLLTCSLDIAVNTWPGPTTPNSNRLTRCREKFLEISICCNFPHQFLITYLNKFFWTMSWPLISMNIAKACGIWQSPTKLEIWKFMDRHIMYRALTCISAHDCSTSSWTPSPPRWHPWNRQSSCWSWSGATLGLAGPLHLHHGGLHATVSAGLWCCDFN